VSAATFFSFPSPVSINSDLRADQHLRLSRQFILAWISALTVPGYIILILKMNFLEESLN